MLKKFTGIYRYSHKIVYRYLPAKWGLIVTTLNHSTGLNKDKNSNHILNYSAYQERGYYSNIQIRGILKS